MADTQHNPHPIFDLEWYVWKEQHECWVPYHIGRKPNGDHCMTMPRVVLIRPGTYRCPSCGKEFPTFLAVQAELEVVRLLIKQEHPFQDVQWWRDWLPV